MSRRACIQALSWLPAVQWRAVFSSTSTAVKSHLAKEDEARERERGGGGGGGGS